MKTMKKNKIAVLFMSILLAFTLAACGSRDSGNNSQASQTSDGGSASEDTQDTSGESNGELAGTSSASESDRKPAGTSSSSHPDGNEVETSAENTGADQETESGKILVVYYSATGNTEAVAGYLADTADASLFELVPAEPYSDADLDWTDDGDRVVYEHDNPDKRDVELVETSVPDWDSYDTVFIGYPIWWHIAAWPVDGFIEANDFTGKTVIPFCTSSSSGLGESGELLAEAAGTGNWLEGERFSSRPSEEEVRTWVESLGL